MATVSKDPALAQKQAGRPKKGKRLGSRETDLMPFASYRPGWTNLGLRGEEEEEVQSPEEGSAGEDHDSAESPSR